jgi:hypothetical protein
MQAKAIIAARESAERIGDPPYFARRVIHKLMNATASPDRDTGAGLWTHAPCDNEYPILVINAITGMAWRTPYTWGLDEFRHSAPEDARHISVFELSEIVS